MPRIPNVRDLCRKGGWFCRTKNPFLRRETGKLAERGGFEPPIGFYTYNALAKRRYRPLSHLSKQDRRAKRGGMKVQGGFHHWHTGPTDRPARAQKFSVVRREKSQICAP